MKRKPIISVITICYNAVSVIEETMLSVLKQTFNNMEYIVIDGGSRDGTVDVIKKYADKLTFWVSESDSGIYNAMNKGIINANGEYLLFMNAGDQFVDEKVLDNCVPYFLQEIDIISGIGYLSGQKWIPAKETEFSIAFFLKKSLNHQATFINHKLFQNNLYREDLRIVSDSIFFFQSLIICNASYIDIPVDIALCEASGLSGQEKRAFAELEKTIKEMLPNRMNYDIDFLIKYHNPAIQIIGSWLYKCGILKKMLRFIRTNRKIR